ncbi:HEPN domain-containing protein, partial [Streptococcus pneumoniae]
IKGKFFAQHSRKSKKWKSNSQQDISLRKLEDNFELILNHWFNKSEELEFIVRQFSKNLHGDLYLEDQLVDAIRNLEVYSRNFKNFKIPQCLSDVEKKARQSLFDFINTHLLEEVRRKFRNKLKFNQKEPNLSERLKNLFDSIDELNLSKIFSNSKRELLIKKLIQTRNYYTHGDSKDNYPEMITDISEMYETKLLLQEVLRYYIYQELDMKYKYKKF